MTYAVVPALRYNPELAAIYEPLLTSREYDPELKVPATKAGITAGMSMTEKQGGSDVRAGTTQATPNADGSYRLTGHKWFTSAPMCDVFLVLAQAPGGLSLLLPAARPARRHPQPDVPAAAQGQARQPRQRLQRGRVRRRHRVAGRRGGPRRADHHRDGQPHPAGLHAGQRHQHAHRPDPRHPPRPAPKGVRRLSDRPAADAQRARRPRGRGRGRHHGRDADGRCHRQRGARRRDARRCCAASAWRPASTGCASAPPRTPPRRWNAWAATATSRSPACRGCTARRR